MTVLVASWEAGDGETSSGPEQIHHPWDKETAWDWLNL